ALNLPERRGVVNLVGYTDNTKPVLMTVPTNVSRIVSVKYDKQVSGDTEANFEDVHFLPLPEFLDRMNDFLLSDAGVSSFSHTMSSGTFTIRHRTDKAPDYFTNL